MNTQNSKLSKRRSLVAWQRLTRSYQQIARRERETLAVFKITTAQFDVLSHLFRSPGLSQQGLAERLLVTKGNICGLIDRLQEASLVERRAVPQDRRSYQLFLTPTGEQVFRQAAPVLEQDLVSIFTGLSDEELQILSGLLHRLEDRTNKARSILLEA